MTKEMQDKLIDKIRKLLALAGSPNENEAASASEKAQALLAEHNLSMSDVKSGTEKGADFIINGDTVTNARPWRRSLGATIAKLYFCTYFFTTVGSDDRHSFVGEKHNIEVARLMFEYLTKTVDRLSRDGSRKVPAHERSGYKTSFRWACSQRLCHRLMDRIRDTSQHETKTATGNTLPALASLYDQTKRQLDIYIEQKVGKMRPSRTKAKFHNARGTMEGREAGNSIGLDAQVGGRTSSGMISSH